MYLKTVKLAGFKSFADRTRLEFRPGVTVVVGPNGSGKSNLVDAVAWVMGTQSPKALRTGKMEDVVFAGTATRPPLNRAEVTLVIDNRQRALPLDLNEVSLTRRLYRDGSSDYEINGVACRLLDIQELLSDSGVGRHQHVIVGQGQIDAILNADPEDHRAVIEEAAGVLKHKTRKEKALRRLERTDADVLRLNDLLVELARQMRPLRRQAEAAGKHDLIAGEVRHLTLYIRREDLRRIDHRSGEMAREEQELRYRLIEEDATAGELRSVLRILSSQAAEVGERLDRDSSAAARLETTIERLRRVAEVAHERERTRRARLEGAVERRTDLENERSQLVDRLSTSLADEAEAKATAEREERQFRRLEDEDLSLSGQEHLSSEGAVALARGEVLSLEAANDRDRREIEAVRQRLLAIGDQLTGGRSEIERLVEEIRQLEAARGQAEHHHQRLVTEKERDQARWEQADAAHTEARMAVAAASGRLEAVQSAAEGLADPQARRLVDEAPGARGSVAVLLDLPAELVAAVDAALGSFGDAVAFDTAGSLEQAVGRLKAAGLGGVPLVTGGGQEVVPARRVAEETGLEPLVHLIGARGDRQLAEALLGDVVLAEGWLAAWRVVNRYPEIRAVTPEGDLVTRTGVRVTNPDGFTPAMVEAAAAALESAEVEQARTHSLMNSARRSFDQSRAAEQRSREELEQLENRMNRASESLASLKRVEAELNEEKARLDKRLGALNLEIEQRTGQIQQLDSRMASLQGEEAERQRVWEQLLNRRQEMSHRREAVRAAWQKAAEKLSAASERRQLVEARLSVIEEEFASEVGRRPSPASLARLVAVEQVARRSIEVLKVHLEALRSRQFKYRQEAVDVGGRLDQVRRQHEDLRNSASDARNKLNAMAVEAAEIRVRREAVIESLFREVDAGEEEALATPRPDLEEGVDPAERLAARQAQLRRMGPINPLAAEEYRQMSERHGFLIAQLSDLEQSRTELRKVVRALDDEIETRFLAAFQEVATAFEQHFTVLFPGGRGRIRLCEPDQPLTSGVEIEAQPLGKKVSRLTLLSGGERSLAALAFLFAIFRARPSPFYLLDEVEAALDDSNLRRFLKLIDAFRGDAQLVIVTHQQQTMGAADVLYGVTMEPGGSSTVVAKQLAAVPVD